MSTEDKNVWKKCSSCKKPIHFGAKYYLCSVSSCNGQRTGYVFCSVLCFEVHLPGARHKDAAAIEEKAPARGAGVASPASVSASTSSAAKPSADLSRSPQRTIIRPASTAAAGISVGGSSATKGPQEVLVIASRLKDYISARSEFNTSASVMDVLSEHLRVIADRAIENARAEGRKTVLDRDFSFLKK